MQFSIFSITNFPGCVPVRQHQCHRQTHASSLFYDSSKLPYMCFSSKNNVYRYLQFFPVIFRLGSNFQYAILLIFVWWFVFNPPRAPIHTPSCVYMHLKWSSTEITSKNPKISTLHPNNFFLAGFCYTILYETYLIPIYSFY